ncbi:unnamed protein product [Blepharisma stoltei]|uniref:Uncharacterized protein n=1 Tax=Blepharisma stoltei TaxID=1481888 RepID=A0AAU9JWF0_9CILI|nr:unnamed protein product [Blepharisma stoltei]
MFEHGILRIPGARPFRRSSKHDIQMREQSWDSRFHLDKLPDYDANKDRHIQVHLGVTKRKKIIAAPGKIRKANDIPNRVPKSASNKGIGVGKPPVLKGQIFKKLTDNLVELWEEKGVPEYQQRLFLSAIENLPAKQKANKMVKEIDETNSNKSVLIHAIKTINAREQALLELKKLTQKDRNSISRQELADKLSNLRTLSLNAVELIQNWREKLSNLSQNMSLSKTQFLINDENYLIKMKTDTIYLADTIIADLIYISNKSDPFFVYASSVSLGKIKSPRKLELPIANSLLSRIRKCEMILLEEGVSAAPVRETLFDLRNKSHAFNNDPPQVNSDKENEDSKSSRRSSSWGRNKSNRSLFSRDNSCNASPEESKIHILPPETPVNIEPQPLVTERLFIESLSGNNIEQQIAEYSNKVPESLKEALGKPENAYVLSQTLRFPAYLWIRQHQNIIGFVILNLENQKSVQKRLMISHISAESLQAFGEILNMMVGYIWENYPCIEIRSGIISKVNEQGKYEADKSIKEHFDKLGFRWKQMIYTGDKTPLQLLGLRRPETAPCDENLPAKQLFGDSIELAYGCAAQISNNSRTIPTHSPYFSLIGISCALRALGQFSSESDLGHKVQDLIGKMQASWVPPAFRFRKEKYDGALNDLRSIGLTLSDFKDDSETSVSCSALGLSWSKSMTTIINGISYTRIYQTQINIMKSDDLLAYIVPTEDPNFSAFFIPCSESNGSMAFNYAKEVLSRITKVEDVKEEIWIPAFSIVDENKLGELINSKVADFSISSCSEIVNLKFLAPLHPQGSIIIHPDPNALVLEDSFIFGIMHSKIDEMLEVPFFVTFVSRSDFSKAF